MNLDDILRNVCEKVAPAFSVKQGSGLVHVNTSDIEEIRLEITSETDCDVAAKSLLKYAPRPDLLVLGMPFGSRSGRGEVKIGSIRAQTVRGFAPFSDDEILAVMFCVTRKWSNVVGT